MPSAARQVSAPRSEPDADPSAGSAFLKYLPAVETHASIQFRHLPDVEREEAVAEAAAAAFVNICQAHRNGNGHRLRSSMVAHYAVLHVKDGQHVGGSADGKSDVMSFKAQRVGGFRVLSLPWDSNYAYNCLEDPTSSVWKEVLLEDKSTPVPEQAAFRIDWSDFLRQQHDRTREALAMLAEGHKQIEVADRLGVTPAAVCQRVGKAEREWGRFQGEI